MAKSVFTPERQATFLRLIAEGVPIKEASSRISVSEATISRALAKGKSGESEYAEFAAQYESIRSGEGQPHLSQDELIRMLEKLARGGSFQAIKLLLDAPWDKPVEEPFPQSTSAIDEVLAKRKQRQQA